MKTTSFQQQMHDIMVMAWQFVKRNGFTISEALKTAWQNYKLHQEMLGSIAHFYFRKVDGSIREAFGTLKATIVPSTNDSNRRRNETVQVYFDTEREGWRCFKKANLVIVK